MKEIKFRIYDKKTKILLHQENINWIDFNGNLIEIQLKEYDKKLNKYTDDYRCRHKRYRNDGYYIFILDINKDIIVMQYTGKRDLKKVEIYEDDVIKYDSSKTQHYKGIVGFENCTFIIKCYYEKIDPFFEWGKIHETKLKYPNIHTLHDKFDIEKIGNIHENPKLMGI